MAANHELHRRTRVKLLGHHNVFRAFSVNSNVTRLGEPVNDYTFTHRYDSPVYWMMLLVAAGISVAFLLASIGNLVFIAFAAIFAFVAYSSFVGIRDRRTSGLTVDATTLRWHRTDSRRHEHAIKLCDIRRIDWMHFDAEFITLTLNDGSTVKLDERHFGDGHAVLAAIRVRTDGVLFFDDGRQWNA